MSSIHAVLPLAACSLLLGSATAQALPLSVVAGERGKATLAEVAGGGISFSGERRVESKSYRFNFPPGADQGPDLWYLIRLDVSVTFDPDSGPGSVLVSGFSRGQAGAQVEFYSERDKRGEPFVRWGSVDLIHGQEEGHSRGYEARVNYRNYLPYRGVRPGPTALVFQVERLGAARVSQVRIGATSGVYATPAGPVELKLEAATPEEETLVAGKPTHLQVEVTNLSSRPAEEVVVSLAPQASHMFVDGPSLRRVGRLRGSETVDFEIGRARPGELRVRAQAAAGNGAEALAVLEAEVREGEEGAESSTPWIALVLAGLVGIAVSVLVRRRTKREAQS